MNFYGWLILIIIALISVWFLFRRRKRNKLRVCVDGYVDPRFENVARVFRENFESGAETGAAFSVYYKGELVVDLWGGYTNKDGRIPWRKDTMSIAFSTSKGINAILAAKFVELGYLDYKQLVSHYWPEFAQNGKENITVEMLLSHQGGLIGFDKPTSLRLIKTDYEKFLSHLEAQKPYWEPGTSFGYHALTWGCYVDALLTKVDPKKRTLDQIFREEIAEPFGIDFFQGVPRDEHYRIIPCLYKQPFWYQLPYLANGVIRSRLMHLTSDPKGYVAAATRRLFTELMGGRDFHAAISDYEVREVPQTSFNGHGTARGIAKLYGIISNGGVHDDKTLMKESTIRTLDQALVQGKDVVFNLDIKIGRGLMIWESPTGSRTFGHPGYGGQMGEGDLAHKIGMAYLTNNINAIPLIDSRYINVKSAFYECLTQIQNNDSSYE